MRRTLLLVSAVLALMLALTGCTTTEDKDTSNQPGSVMEEDSEYNADGDGAVTDGNGDKDTADKNDTTVKDEMTDDNRNDTNDKDGSDRDTGSVTDDITDAVRDAGDAVEDIADGTADAARDTIDALDGDDTADDRR